MEKNAVKCEPPPGESWVSLRQLTEAAARAGGAVARQAFGLRQRVRFKDDLSEVTDVDVAAQEAVIAGLRAKRPRDAFVGEESPCLAPESAGQETAADASSSPPLLWVIDPLDGTRNYVRGIPLFSCSVAVLQAGVPVAGAVYDPLREDLYSASAGEGAFHNGQPLVLREPAETESKAGAPPRTLLVAIPSTRREWMQAAFLGRTGNVVVRNFGSTALHLAMVAAEQLDVALGLDCKLWDIAAGWLLVTAAGGSATTPAGQPLFPLLDGKFSAREQPILAAPPRLHAEILKNS